MKGVCIYVLYSLVKCVCVCGVCVCVHMVSLCVLCGVYVWWVWRCAERRCCGWCVCEVCMCACTDAHLEGLSSQGLAKWTSCNGIRMEMTRERVHCHCTYFSVPWVLITDSCPDVLMFESCSSFPAGPLKWKWCNFYSNSSTRDPFLRSLIVDGVILQSLLPC